MSNTLRILRVEPGKAPEEKTLNNDLKSLQAEVGGLIECLYLDNDIILVCNDEGKLNGMEMNRRLGHDIVCGPFFLVSDDGEGDFASLSDEQMLQCQNQFAQPDQFAEYEPNAEPFMQFISM